mmetsp:Transcript_10082/g.10027  ORF Transcript_10082/g.10027 Transcript_10082/m.10027 type:complete len:131 (-) Transcript_10082:1118-1510(-)
MQFFGQQEQNQENVQVYSSYSHTEIMSVHSGNEESQEIPSTSDQNAVAPEEEKKEDDREERDSIKAIRDKMKKAASHRRNSSYQEVSSNAVKFSQIGAEIKESKLKGGDLCLSRGHSQKEEVRSNRSGST